MLRLNFYRALGSRVLPGGSRPAGDGDRDHSPLAALQKRLTVYGLHVVVLCPNMMKARCGAAASLECEPVESFAQRSPPTLYRNTEFRYGPMRV
jgi:hypothetical protein